jgi:chromate reductase, NAD(P)H dehydrogenase (quinone)
MAHQKLIVGISGTNRPGNYTSRALEVTLDEIRKVDADTRIEVVDGRQLQLGFPGSPSTPDAQKLQTLLREAAGVVLATPEYHGTFAAFTKLIIENLGHPSALKDKPVALLGVAAGRIGAIKSVEHLRSVLAHVGALVIPGSISVAGIQTAFDRNTGAISDANTEEALRGLARALTTFMKDYVCPRYVLESQVRDGGVTRPLVMPV